jgi:bifunctional diaminopimelate decarboxylase / aspartate kinase
MPAVGYSVFSALAKLTEQFTDVSVLNIGGGLGVVERPGQQPLDLTQLNHSLQKAKSHHPDLQLWMEPGRYLVAEAGVLLAKVTQVKNKGELHFVGIETGMNSLIRPALYGSYHEIVNLTRLDEPKVMRANVVGPICETGDTLGYSRWLPVCREGDVMLIATVGAYGRTMSSCYNLRDPAIENFLDRSNV